MGGNKDPSIEFLDFDHQGDDGVAVREVQTYTSLLGVTANSSLYKTATSYSYTLNITTFTAECQEPRNVNQTDVASPSPGSQFVLEVPSQVGTITQLAMSLITFPTLTYAVVRDCTETWTEDGDYSESWIRSEAVDPCLEKVRPINMYLTV